MNQSSRDVPGRTGQGQAGREKDREGVGGLAKAARNTALTMRRKRSAAGWLILGGSAKRPSGLAKLIPVLPVGDAASVEGPPRRLETVGVGRWSADDRMVLFRAGLQMLGPRASPIGSSGSSQPLGERKLLCC
ncbi:hypothetical protein [Kyrpidia tusciae]|uniref:Uncharacterized protein n=1 Tax=Kyrpidia tusciae (strain DSM 2912 / NBRC 15312 / T2) TaxID=562970 RepID=D5WY50_KYRT2|nr:hypothetical protein [Kyrpidia tusciae]ADG06109.1 hypothetical protein Btus_1395 [Kyrpidia tusciae DSM 2912]